MVSELTVIIKDAEKSLRKKFLIYETYQVSDQEPKIKACVHETLENFDGEPTDVQIKISMEML